MRSIKTFLSMFKGTVHLFWISLKEHCILSDIIPLSPTVWCSMPVNCSNSWLILSMASSDLVAMYLGLNHTRYLTTTYCKGHLSNNLMAKLKICDLFILKLKWLVSGFFLLCFYPTENFFVAKPISALFAGNKFSFLGTSILSNLFKDVSLPLISFFINISNTLNSTYNKVACNEKLAIMKENLHTKYTPFTYNDVALNEKPPIMKQNLHIFFSL